MVVSYDVYEKRNELENYHARIYRYHEREVEITSSNDHLNGYVWQRPPNFEGKQDLHKGSKEKRSG